MSAGLVVAVGMALAFAFTNGVHDAANAIATLVATRAARPGTAVLLAAAGNVLGPLLLGSAVANTIAGIVTVPSNQMIQVLGAALTGAVVWNGLTWWRGLPSSSGHALLGGLVGAALAEGGTGSVNWGGFDGIKPVGVLGVAAVAHDRARGRLRGRARRRPRVAPRRAAKHPARTRARARRAMDHVGRSRAEPRRQRRAKGRRRRRAPSRGRRRARAPRSAAMGRTGVRPRTHRGDRARVAGRSCGRSAGASS